MKIYLHIQETLLKETLEKLLVQGDIYLTQDENECDAILYTQNISKDREVSPMSLADYVTEGESQKSKSQDERASTPPHLPKGIPSLDFLTLSKPLRFLDLLSHLHNLPYAQALHFAHFSLDLREKNLTNLLSQDQQRLTEKEVQLLHYLIQNKGHPLSRESLLKGIWAYHPEADTHTAETHIYRLRQKIERDPTHPEILINCEQGYALKTEASTEEK